MRRQHRIDRSCERLVPQQRSLTQAFVASLGAKLDELVMRVEDHAGHAKTAGGPAGSRMKSNNEKRLAAETHRKIGIIGVAADARIIAMAELPIPVRQRLKSFPQRPFK